MIELITVVILLNYKEWNLVLEGIRGVKILIIAIILLDRILISMLLLI